MNGDDRARGVRGFTLVEMLVSLAVLGLVAAMLLAGLATAGLTAARARDAEARIDAVADAQALLRGRLERLRPELRLDSSLPVIDAQGTMSAFDFIAPPLDRDAPDALRRYRLMLTASGVLVLFVASSLDQRVDVSDMKMVGWAPLRLMRGVATLNILYFGPDDLKGGRRWQNDWGGRAQPPDLIRIRVAFPPGDRRVWPDLMVRPRATVNAACRIDEQTGRCGTTL